MTLLRYWDSSSPGNSNQLYTDKESKRAEILYQYFGNEERSMYDEEKSKKKALCIRTYISCMDTQARTLLTQNGFDLSSSPPRAIFDYPLFAVS
ncbi:hypothetical protein Glove_229g98 [Diversispora epigaea]|uniref:Uncharacterized protein n=1 Tax=Diversispora epigaea TaxID=1348612 RepID=A0A397IKS2_9GLOM|nr:hypothetical protein Glove_229g98 [Diversispora epigaea]